MLEEELLPGAGLVTATGKEPEEDALPVAVSWAVDTKAVGKGIPASVTLAPETKLPPLSVREKFPMPTLAGLMPVSTGIGFSRETLLESLAVKSAALVARIVTVAGFGKIAGAMYLPVESIVPTVAEPPLTSFTDQVTAVFVVPETATEKA